MIILYFAYSCGLILEIKKLSNYYNFPIFKSVKKSGVGLFIYICSLILNYITVLFMKFHHVYEKIYERKYFFLCLTVTLS